jgi:hypothetical protein
LCAGDATYEVVDEGRGTPTSEFPVVCDPTQLHLNGDPSELRSGRAESGGWGAQWLLRIVFDEASRVEDH